uniref:Uncharacterized protein n=1 Tax=Cannabis sativa TaxID=3483 RepID=A0A803PLS3_CANSA
MKRMTEHFQNKFEDLAESDDDSSVEVMVEEHAPRQIEAETSNSHKDKGKGKTQKATGTFEPGCPSAPGGKIVSKGQITKVPKPKGQKQYLSDSINQDKRMTDRHSEDIGSIVDLHWRLDAK